MVNTFILSDESVMSGEHKILINGIDYDRFKKNPVMLFMHDRECGVIGRWENIRIEGTQLLADAVFDEKIPLGAIVKQRVESGFLRSASVGLDECEIQNLNGIKTIIKSLLVEVSIVDIPANQNSVKTAQKGGKCLYFTFDKRNTGAKDLRTQILSLLDLGEQASDEDLLIAINELIKNKPTGESRTEQALRLGYADKSQERVLKAMERYDLQGFNAFIKSKQEEQQENIKTVVNKAIINGKIIYCERGIYEKIGLKMGINSLRSLLLSMPDRIKITEFIQGGKDYNKATWGLNEYRKYAPQELKENPDLYNKLLALENGKPIEKTLDWYRRNDPDFLKNNPSEYNRLLKDEIL